MQLAARNCPICDTISEEVYCESNINWSQLDEFAFASRKIPELMHHRMVRCTQCDLLYANPAPGATTLHQEYEQSSFDSSEEAHYAASTYIHYLPRTAPTQKALDIGSGGGEFLGQLLRRGFASVEGVEPSPAAIATAADNIKPLIRQGIFEPGLYAPNSYSLISCFQTLEHVEGPLAISKSVYELLHKGGVYFTISHNRRGMINRLLGKRSPIFDIEHLQLLSPQSVKALMQQAGFTKVQLFRVWNKYPLHYLVKLFPLPKAIKNHVLNLLKATKIGYLPVTLPLGNMAVIATK